MCLNHADTVIVDDRFLGVFQLVTKDRVYDLRTGLLKRMNRVGSGLRLGFRLGLKLGLGLKSMLGLC